MNKGMLILTNIITGIIISILTVLALGISGMAEGPQPVDSYFWLLPWFLWVIGLMLQFKRSTRRLGLIVTLLPITYYLVSFSLEFI